MEVEGPIPSSPTMKIIIKAKPGSNLEKVEKIDEHNYVISVREPAMEGKANAAIIKVLASHFDIAPSLVEILSGHMAKIKVIEIHQ
jgi:uncharacterized protein (TIGR00251 family)